MKKKNDIPKDPIELLAMTEKMTKGKIRNRKKKDPKEVLIQLGKGDYGVGIGRTSFKDGNKSEVGDTLILCEVNGNVKLDGGKLKQVPGTTVAVKFNDLFAVSKVMRKLIEIQTNMSRLR